MEKVLKETVYSCRNKGRIKIGDPLYFDKGIEKFVFDGKIEHGMFRKVRVREIEVVEDDFKYSIVEALVGMSDDLLKVDMYMNDREYADTVEKDINLLCDTAMFSIETEKGCHDFHTGCDCQYGVFRKYKDRYGAILMFSVDEDMMSFEEFEDAVRKLFS